MAGQTATTDGNWDVHVRGALEGKLLGQDLLAVGAFRCVEVPGGQTEDRRTSMVDAIGRLPGRVVLAVTTERLYAFAARLTRLASPHEVAMWERRNIDVTTEVTAGSTRLTICSDDGTRITFMPAGTTDDLVGLRVVTVLVDPPAVPHDATR